MTDTNNEHLEPPAEDLDASQIVSRVLGRPEPPRFNPDDAGHTVAAALGKPLPDAKPTGDNRTPADVVAAAIGPRRTPKPKPAAEASARRLVADALGDA